jgi:hypothetical protein
MTCADRLPALVRAAAVQNLIQGEVLELPDACVVLADAEWPLDAASADAAAAQNNEGVAVVGRAADIFVLLTQTCDLQHTDEESYLCQIAPVFECAPELAHSVERGRRPGLAAVPWFSDGHVADLALITTVERSLIVEKPSLARPQTAQERLHFAEAVSRHFTRAALPDPVCLVLAPFLERIKEKQGRKSEEGQCIQRIATLRVEASPDLDAPAPNLTLLIVLDDPHLPPLPDGDEIDQSRVDALVARSTQDVAKEIVRSRDPLRIREGWYALAEKWIQRCVEIAAATEDVGAIDVEVLSGRELDFTRARNAPELDLAYMSTRAA